MRPGRRIGHRGHPEVYGSNDHPTGGASLAASAWVLAAPARSEVDRPEGPAAVKVFAGDTLSNLIHYLLTGAPNPCIWNEDAIRGACHRRKGSLNNKLAR